jgi:hypothetical protein
MKRILGSVLAGLTLAACSGPDNSPRAAASPAATAVVVTDCGTFVLNQGEEVPESAVRCLAEAVRAGTPARLKATRPTTEGDPLPITYTAGTDGSVAVLTDSRQDKFGVRTITREICTGPPIVPDLIFARCAER